MKSLLMLLGLAALPGAAAAAAEIIDIAWTSEARFAHAATLAPNAVLEVCGKLPQSSRVAWSFEADTPLAFNIHVHHGKAVAYPARLERTERAQGLQTFDAEPAHCWMWTNKGMAAAKLGIALQQLR